MISIGKTAKSIRETHGLSQKEAAEKLGISNVHLCNLENDKVSPSTDLLERYRDTFGTDLYVLAWCEHGDVEMLPKSVRAAARRLQEAWKSRLRART